jgi:pantoate--beta-alanine ligase
LNEDQIKLAATIFKEVNFIKEHIHNQSLEQLKNDASTRLTQKGFHVDYIEIANAADLSTATSTSGKLVALAAATTGNIRLIDNIVLN